MNDIIRNNEDDKFRPAVNLDEELQRELEEAMGEMSLEEMIDVEDAANRSTREQIRRGRVVAIHGDDIFVDMGGKNQGLLPASQFVDDPLPAVNDIVEVVLEGYDENEGLLMLSREGAVSAATWNTLAKGQILEGRVVGHNKGGLELVINSIRAFMPISQVELSRIEDLSGYVNQKMQCEVVEIDRSAENIVVSRRAVLEREAAETREKFLATLVEGKTVRGKVKTIMPYGAFVDIGGVDGLLHISDMSYRRIDDPKSVVQENQELEVKILKFDRETGRISLGLKQALADPWVGAETKWPPKSVITGRVSRLADFGAFVELEEGVEGLVPIGELAYGRRIRYPSEAVKEGEIVKVLVQSVDLARKRISLSMKQVGDDPWTGASVRWPENSVVEGTVTRITDFGAFVELVPGLEGLVHISELSHTRVRSAHDVCKEGQAVRAKVLGVDEEARRISLSIKQATAAAEQVAPTSDQAPPIVPQRVRKKPLKGGLE